MTKRAKPDPSGRGRKERLRDADLWPGIAAGAALIALVCAAPGAGAQAAAPQTQGGTQPLPNTPPPTGLQAALPPSAAPLPKATNPRLVSPGLSAFSGDFANRPLAIQDAVAVALATNRSLALSVENLLRARGRTNEAASALNPTLGLNFTYTRLFRGQSFEIQPGQRVDILVQNQPVLGLSAALPIDLFGIIRSARDQARFNEVATRIDINRTLNDLVLNVKTGFYDALRAEALVTVQQNNLDNAQARLRDAEAKLRAGVVARFDVIRAQTDVLNAQQALVQARYNVSLALANLNNTLGLDVSSALRITSAQAVETPPGVAPPADLSPAAQAANPAPPPGEGAAQPAPGQPPALPPDRNAAAQNVAPVIVSDRVEYGEPYENVLGEALKTRPEVFQAEASVAAARRGIRLAARSLVPTLSLSVGGQYTPLAGGFAPITTQGSAVVGLNIPFYDGGLAAARRQQAEADLSNAETNRRQAVDLITLDVRQAYLTLRQARDRVAVANAALGQAREAFRLARVRYDAGVAAQSGLSPLIEVSDAQNALVLAESNQVNALYDYNNARSRLDRAAGRYSYLGGGPGYAAPPPPKEVGSRQ